jgi:putative component of toxin-antitoxin plasmid stabilization module
MISRRVCVPRTSSWDLWLDGGVHHEQRGPEVVVLLVGRGKANQARDIELAKRLARQV